MGNIFFLYIPKEFETMKVLRKMALGILFSNYRQELQRKTEKSAL